MRQRQDIFYKKNDLCNKIRHSYVVGTFAIRKFSNMFKCFNSNISQNITFIKYFMKQVEYF